MKTLALGGSINAGLRSAMEEDPRVLMMGEDIGVLGEYSESPTGCRNNSARKERWARHSRNPALSGRQSAWRYEDSGQYAKFSSTAFDQIVSQLAKMRAPGRDQ